MAIHISQPKPLLCIRHNRFKSDRFWRISDVCVSEADVIAVSGYHIDTERTFIDLFNNFSDSKSPQIVSSIEFEPHIGVKYRLVCFLEEDDNVVTCIGEQVNIVAARENKTIKHRVLKGKVGYLTVWNGNIFVAVDASSTVHEYDRQLNLVTVIQLIGIPHRDSCVSISFSFDAYFVCTSRGRAMKLSTKDGEVVYEFDDHTRQNAHGLTVSVRRGVAVIMWQWNKIRVYSINDNSLILSFNVDDAVHRIRMSDRGTIVTGNHFTGEVRVYNVTELLQDDQLKSKGSVHQHNVERLSKGLFKSEMKSSYVDATDMLQKLRPPSIEQPQIVSPAPSVDGECSASVTFPNEDPKRKRKQTDTYDSENNMETKKKQKTLRSNPISQEENETQTSSENIFLKAQATIGQSGGTISIPNTHVKLRIPPNALPEEVGNCVIQLRIIPQRMLKDKEAAKIWNTPTVVELLPNNLQLRKHVKLILPHCFVLKRPRPSAKVFVSHQEQGNMPFWEEEADCDYTIETTTCILRLKRFCWVRLRINDNEILAKKLVLYTAGKRPLTNCNKFTVVVGYYPDLPGEDKEIEFATISSSTEHSRPFTFQNKGKRNELPILHFKASQEEGMQAVELTINLEELRDRSPQPEIGPSDPLKRWCWALSEEISDEWKAVGRNLNITDAQLNQIETDNAGNTREKIYAMFLHWLQHEGTSATRSTLSLALKKAGRTDLTSDVD